MSLLKIGCLFKLKPLYLCFFFAFLPKNFSTRILTFQNPLHLREGGGWLYGIFNLMWENTPFILALLLAKVLGTLWFIVWFFLIVSTTQCLSVPSRTRQNASATPKKWNSRNPIFRKFQNTIFWRLWPPISISIEQIVAWLLLEDSFYIISN